MIVNQLEYSMMIIIVIITTVNGNCHENELAFNTSVNATPGMNIIECCKLCINYE